MPLSMQITLKLKTKAHNIKVEILKKKVKCWEKIFAIHIYDKTNNP